MNTIEQQLADLEPTVVACVARRCRGWREDVRQDIEQEVRIRLWQALRDAGHVRCVRAFGHVIIERQTITAIRAFMAHAEPTVALPEEAPGGAEDPAEDISVRELAHLLDHHADLILPPRYRRLLNALRVTQTPSEAARLLGVKPETVYTMTSRLYRRLRDYLRGTRDLSNAA